MRVSAPGVTSPETDGKFDFHLHTDVSDGHLSPEQLWQIVRERGMTGVSITDHDTVDAYDRLRSASLVSGGGEETGERPTSRERTGRVAEPWLLPGVEFSTSTKGEELHILGYFPRGFPGALRDFVESVLRARDERMAKGIRQLRERGIDISLRECREAAHGRVLSRSHVAEVLKRKRYVRQEKQAYRRFLGPGAFPASGVESADVVSRIGDLGGLAIWAHPRENQCAQHLRPLLDAGLHGVEVYTPWRQKRERSRVLRVVRELGLVVTAGSDWHGQPGGRGSDGFCADENMVGEFLHCVHERLGP